MNALEQLFNDFQHQKVGVVGDVMLDTYVWGKTDRISPEAPVPIVAIQQKDNRVGGAANVALNARSLGAAVTLFSVTGADDEALILEALLSQQEIAITGILQSDNRITTNKTRIISRNQQMMRLDAESTHDLLPEDEDRLLEKIATYIREEKPSVMIIEDYNKGVLTERVILKAVGLCREAGVITAVDPKRKNFFTYKGVDLFKPNLKEVKEGLNLLFEKADHSLLKDIHAQLQAQLEHRISLITLSEQGVFFQDKDETAILPSHLRNIADVSGAGDTVIAVAAMAYAITKDIHLAASLANIAGGLVCEEVGTVAINRKRLLEEARLLLS